MGQQSPESRQEGEAARAASPPEELKPWYYQYWFLYPTIIFWPLWPVLIIRSPWHNGLVSGALAWAMLISGSYMAYQLTGGMEVVDRLRTGDGGAILTLQLIFPGLLLTLITQVHWTLNRRRILSAAAAARSAPAAGNDAPESATARRRGRRANRRRNRR